MATQVNETALESSDVIFFEKTFLSIHGSHRVCSRKAFGILKISWLPESSTGYHQKYLPSVKNDGKGKQVCIDNFLKADVSKAKFLGS